MRRRMSDFDTTLGMTGPTGCAYNYVVTANKPTNVSASVCGHFTSRSDLNLVLACVPQRPALHGSLHHEPRGRRHAQCDIFHRETCCRKSTRLEIWTLTADGLKVCRGGPSA